MKYALALAASLALTAPAFADEAKTTNTQAAVSTQAGALALSIGPGLVAGIAALTIIAVADDSSSGT